VAIDAHPKHAVSLGAAQVLGSAAAAAPGTVVGPTAPTVPTASAAGAGGGGAAPPLRESAGAGSGSGSGPIPLSAASGAPAARRGRRKIPTGALIAVVVLLVVAAGAVALLASGGGDNGSATSNSAPSATAGDAGPNTKCTSESGRCARLTGVNLEGSTYIATYTAKGFEPIIYTAGQKGSPEDHHVHFFFDTVGADHAGSNGTPPGICTVWDRDSGHGKLRFDALSLDNQGQNGGDGATKLCILVADAIHGVEQGSGNCLPLPTA
jgi:hypothetical protein